MNILRQFNYGLKKTSVFLNSSIFSILKSKKIDGDTLEKIEEVLLSSDIGLEVTNQLIEKIKKSKIKDIDNPDFIFEILSKEIEIILEKRESKLIKENFEAPEILLFIGVNGSGKTTTIGKLINLIPLNKKILVAACDTFRAAAVEQLNNWAIKRKADFHQGLLNQDPASVAYDAAKKTLKENYDYLIVDTAGRLSNNTNLLNQLVKVKNVLNKLFNNNIKTILVLDGTNGSNMVNQVEIFGKALDVKGLIITKIDGTAKGGALISIAKKYEIPINFVGIGESVEDLFEFSAKNFSRSLLGIEKNL